MSSTATTPTTTTAPAAAPGPARTVPTPYELLARLKATAPEFAAAAQEKGRFKTLPPRKLMLDLQRAAPGAEDELIRDRFLCRGGAMLLAAQSGKGKSSLVRQMAICFAAGLPAFGLAPARPLRQLIIQAENDEGDEAAFRDGVARCPYVAPGAEEDHAPEPLPPEVLNAAQRLILVARCDDKTGDGFLEVLDALLEADGPFDLVWIDPFLAYLGGDANDQKTVSLFLRNGLQPMIRRRNIGVGLVHHTPKPIRQQAKNAPIVDLGAYLGAGSAELTNWPRAVLTLENTSHRGVFRFRAPKRGGRLGWRDPATNEYQDSRFLAHATDGSIYWREPSAQELEEALIDFSQGNAKAGPKATPQAAVDILSQAGGEMIYSDLLTAIMAATGAGRSGSALAIQKAVSDGLLRKRGTCPAFYRVTGKAKASPYVPYAQGDKT